MRTSSNAYHNYVGYASIKTRSEGDPFWCWFLWRSGTRR